MKRISLNLDRYQIVKKKKSDISSIVDYYYQVRGWSNYTKEFWTKNKNVPMYNYPRNSRDAKILYNLVNLNFQKCIQLIDDEKRRSKEYSDYNWRISTITKRLKVSLQK